MLPKLITCWGRTIMNCSNCDEVTATLNTPKKEPYKDAYFSTVSTRHWGMSAAWGCVQSKLKSWFVLYPMMYPVLISYDSARLFMLCRVSGCSGPNTLFRIASISWCSCFASCFEAGVAPCYNIYISSVYKKSERGKRLAVVFEFAAFLGRLMITRLSLL